MTFRARLTVLAAASTLTAATFGAANSAMAAPAVAWQIKQAADPTALPAGTAGVAQYHLLITNVGGKEAASGATVTDTLSAGATAFIGGFQKPFFQVPGGDEIPCAVAGQEVICEVEETIQVGEQIEVYVPLAIEADPPATVGNEVTVSSPGVSPESNTLRSRTGEEVLPLSFVESAFGLSGSAFEEAGETPEAGDHPFDVELSAHVQSVLGPNGAIIPRDRLRSLHLELPAGMIANPMAVQAKDRCTLAEIQAAVAPNQINACPAASQVGIAHFNIGLTFQLAAPLIEMVPPPGEPAEFAFVINGTIVHIRGGLGGNFRLTAGSEELTAKFFPVTGVKVDLWGIPSDHRHDSQRRGAGMEVRCENLGGCSTESSTVPFLTMPTSCTEPVTLGASATGWLGGQTERSTLFEDLEGDPVEPTGCNQLAFEPEIESKATTDQAESPSGLDFSIHQPQEESLEGRATAALRNATVTLPEGMTLNPSAANGLSSCTEEQMGYAPEEGKIRFKTIPQSCPNAAKVGTIEVRTPLLESPQPGSVYVAKPFDNPFGSLLAIYLAVEDEETGIVAKLAGKVTPDPVTGQLTATFTENPELPIEDIDLHFFNGPSGALTTPLTCGDKTTTTTLTPWSTPEGADAHPSDAFETNVGCYGSEGAAPKTVAFSAGTESPLAGAFSPFILRIARPDGSQHITAIETTLPEGLTGRLAGIPYCPEGDIALAKSREAPEKGKEEQVSPSCPAASEVGTVHVTAGSGITPIPVSGRAYLAGPYKGAPLSLVAIVPAVAGPFDLGDVVTRVALNVGEYDARIHAVSDPLPTILDGIPLDVRSVEIKLDRPGFTLNPTSCEEASIEGAATTGAGQTAPLSNRFQVGECGRLKFKPKFSLSLKGRTTRSGHPALRAVLKMPKGGANIARAQVGLPHSEFLDQGNLDQVCTQGNLKAGTCPKRTVYGHAKAWTPLLDKPLEGPVYLGVGFGYTLPALVAELNGQIRVLLVGKTDTTNKDGLRNTFEAVPDAPVEKFVLELKGGPRYGLLENSENICRKRQKASVSFTAASGKVAHLTPTITNSCKKAKGKHKKRKKRHGGR
jgi:hypothetical protein